MNANIAIIIAPRGFQDLEFSAPYDYFVRNGANVDVYSTKKGVATGSYGSEFKIDHTLAELDVKNYDAIVFIGGPGTPIVRSDDTCLTIAKDAIKHGKVLAAICWSPTILAKAGVLNGKNATVWNGMDTQLKVTTTKYLEENGAIYTGMDVTVDGKIITANGPPAAQKYAHAIWTAIRH